MQRWPGTLKADLEKVVRRTELEENGNREIDDGSTVKAEKAMNKSYATIKEEEFEPLIWANVRTSP
ncbi:Hypothetical protein CINCED_3A002108 [Cinara cedri]|uniref:Uncharacterized protein n=1 Tax=Cinara cedri TaxID=506608 RepID=A0A5E4MYH6_9HEMI|nr:Hypothetical protein CINCED_3A002108 [Cinara cedri]